VVIEGELEIEPAFLGKTEQVRGFTLIFVVPRLFAAFAGLLPFASVSG
jgi:hypothetical protein